MTTIQKSSEVIKSYVEFEKMFLPKTFNERINKTPDNGYDLGVKWAKESFKKIRGN